MRDLESKDDQGGDHPVGEHQVVVRPGPGCPQAVAAPSCPQLAFLGSGPFLGRLADQRAESAAGQAGTDTMGQGRAGQVLRHNNINSHGPSHVPTESPPLSCTTSLVPVLIVSSLPGHRDQCRCSFPWLGSGDEASLCVVGIRTHTSVDSCYCRQVTLTRVGIGDAAAVGECDAQQASRAVS